MGRRKEERIIKGSGERNIGRDEMRKKGDNRVKDIAITILVYYNPTSFENNYSHKLYT